MRLHDLKPKAGARHRRKRVGRGRGSGRGKTSTRGTKGQLSRAGSSVRPGFEGGQMPLARRLPKRGFNNKRFATVLLPVNLKGLEENFESGATVDEQAIRDAGLANGKSDGIKVLGVGKLTKKLAVTATGFSASAQTAIEAAGGSCTVIEKPKKETPRKKPIPSGEATQPEEPKAQKETQPEPKATDESEASAAEEPKAEDPPAEADAE